MKIMTDEFLKIVWYVFFVGFPYLIGFVASVFAIIDTVKIVKLRRERKQLEEELRKIEERD